MTQVFISYASEDRPRASLIATILANRGWNVWWDRELLAGSSFDEVIEHELDEAAAVIVLWSPRSLKSDWVRAEAASAVERDVLIPIIIGGSRVPLRFRNLHTIDLSNWNGGPDDPRLESLERALRGLISTGPINITEEPLPDDDTATESTGAVDETVTAETPDQPDETQQPAAEPDESARHEKAEQTDDVVIRQQTPDLTGEWSATDDAAASAGHADSTAEDQLAAAQTDTEQQPATPPERNDDDDWAPTVVDRFYDAVPDWARWWHAAAAAAFIAIVVALGVVMTRPDPDPIVAQDPPIEDDGDPSEDSGADQTTPDADTDATSDTGTTAQTPLVDVARSVALGPDDELAAGESRTSPSERYTLFMQGDGNLVLIDESFEQRPPIWSTLTFGNPGAVAVMQEGDGNFVVYAQDSTESDPKPLFSAGTENNVGATLRLSDDGKVVVESATGDDLWDSTDGHDEFPVDLRSAGPRVTQIQTWLAELDFDPGPSGVDGIFGPTTDSAVRDWQASANRDPDGVVDRATWNELRADANPGDVLRPVTGCATEGDGTGGDDPCEGEFIQVPGDIGVYLVENGVLRRVPDESTMACLGGFELVRTVAESTLEVFPISGHPATCTAN